MTSVYCLLQVCTAPHVLFLYHNRLVFSAITRNITTLNLLHMKIFNYLVFRNVRNFIHMKILRIRSEHISFLACFTKWRQRLALCKQWYLPFKYAHFYNSTVAISTAKMSLSYEYSCKRFCLLIAGTTLAELFIPTQTTKAYNTSF